MHTDVGAPRYASARDLLRDFLYCAECGAKITAGTHKGHVYYRCTHGKGDCSQRSYVREEVLADQVADVLSRIAIEPDVVEALLDHARAREAERTQGHASEEEAIRSELTSNERRGSKLLDAMLDGTVSKETYAAKAAELERERTSLELRLEGLSSPSDDVIAQVGALLVTGSTAYSHFEDANPELKRRILSEVLCNLQVEDGHIAS